MNNQEAFERVTRHLLTQMQRSVGVGIQGGCWYRSPTGLKCAVGCLIDDDKYSSDMEGVWVSKLMADFGKQVSNLVGVEPYLLTELQDIHDRKVPQMWRTCLYELGIRRFLNVSFIDTIPHLSAKVSS